MIRQPDIRGPYGAAWLASVPADHPNAETTVVAWFMRLPRQAAGWDKYMLSVVDLADLPGRPPAHRRYPQAEYELMVAALHPDQNPTYESVDTWIPMTPVNVIEHFHGLTREQIGTLARDLAYACVQGILVAETQMYVEIAGQAPKMMVIKQLADLWHETVANTVAHLRGEHRAGDPRQGWRWN